MNWYQTQKLPISILLVNFLDFKSLKLINTRKLSLYEISKNGTKKRRLLDTFI